MLFANFKVLDIILERIIHILFVKGEIPIFLEKFFAFNFIFLFCFFLEGKDYVVLPYGTVMTKILDMRPGKHDLHFLVD
jgi:hypothetical protein